jgi:predicted enzyme related to lactoylglutathione lyase
MTTRSAAIPGAPCWADLWTSDVDEAARFYGGLLGWRAEEPSAEFGGYFMFTLDGVPVAGGMPDMPEMPANNTWKVYLATTDIEASLRTAEAEGATPLTPAVPVADLGVQAVLVDPSGATFGLWQPGTFHGFSTLSEPGAPRWFELHSRDYAGSVAFYRALFGWTIQEIGGPGMAYSTAQEPGGEMVAGIMEAGGEQAGSSWFLYWTVADADAAVTKVAELGGKVLADPVDTPFGRLATASDPMGAEFKLAGPTTGS